MNQWHQLNKVYHLVLLFDWNCKNFLKIEFSKKKITNLEGETLDTEQVLAELNQLAMVDNSSTGDSSFEEEDDDENDDTARAAASSMLLVFWTF